MISKACISYLGQKNWEILPQEIQECESHLKFEVKIKSWNPLKIHMIRSTINFVYIVNFIFL